MAQHRMSPYIPSGVSSVWPEPAVGGIPMRRHDADGNPFVSVWMVGAGAGCVDRRACQYHIDRVLECFIPCLQLILCEEDRPQRRSRRRSSGLTVVTVAEILTSVVI